MLRRFFSLLVLVVLSACATHSDLKKDSVLPSKESKKAVVIIGLYMSPESQEAVGAQNTTIPLISSGKSIDYDVYSDWKEVVFKFSDEKPKDNVLINTNEAFEVHIKDRNKTHFFDVKYVDFDKEYVFRRFWVRETGPNSQGYYDEKKEGTEYTCRFTPKAGEILYVGMHKLKYEEPIIKKPKFLNSLFPSAIVYQAPSLYPPIVTSEGKEEALAYLKKHYPNLTLTDMRYATTCEKRDDK